MGANCSFKDEIRYSQFCFVAGTSCQWDLLHSVIQAHKKSPVAMENLKAQDWLSYTGREELHLLQVTTLQGLVCGCQSLKNSSVF